MLDYEIDRCSRRCAATDRELKDGETCFSALVPESAAVVRRDYAAEAWQGPPENTIGWWKTTIVDPQAGRPHWAPNDVMLNYFERLLEDSGAEDARYVLALLLIRRRILRVEGIQLVGESSFLKKPMTKLEALFQKQMAFYYQYLQGEPRFDCRRALEALKNTGIECPPVTVEFISKMAGWYVNLLNAGT